MKKLIIYQSGARYIMHDMSFSLHDEKPIKEYDLTEATHEEMKSLVKNPHQDGLLESIGKRH